MKDTFGREIDYLRISVTDRCNFRCQHCIPPTGIDLLPRSEILSYEEILKIVNVAILLGINKIRITGGEPLVRKGVIGFLERLTNIPAIQRVSLTTNGYLLTKFARDLARLSLSSINIGLNTLKETRFQNFTGVNGFKNVWAGIEELINLKVPLKINVVLLRGFNDDEVIDFARLSIDYPITVRFIEYMPCGDWSSNQDLVMEVGLVKERINRELGELIPVEQALAPVGSGPAHYFRVRPEKSSRRMARLAQRAAVSEGKLARAQGLLGFIMPVSKPFCSQCNRIRLTPDGRLKSCLLSDESLDVKSVLRAPLDSKHLTGRAGRMDLVKETIKQAILNKPKEHSAQRTVQMSQIGG